MAEMFQDGVHRATGIRRAVVIGNGFAGAENQSVGLVRALGLWGRQSLYRVSRPKGGINEWLHWLRLPLHKKDGPLLVVASGRDTIPVSSAIKQLAPENVFLVQIQHPRSHVDRFDLVIAPRHDYYPLTTRAQKQIPWFLRRWITPREPPGKSVVLYYEFQLLTVGADQADFAALMSAASVWHAELAPLPKPLLVVNIGGPSNLAKHLVAMLQNVLWSCGSVRISFSGRTTEQVSRVLRKEFSTNPKVYIWHGEANLFM